jgi:hypothetical protein
MFRNTATAAEAPPQAEDVIVPADNLIPVSVLALDLDATPAGGWTAYLTGRGIPVVLDRIGRSAISSADARQLLDEKRDDEARKREAAKRQEQQAVEADRQWRAQLHPGLPAGMFGDGVDPILAQIQAEKDADPRRRSMQEELWDRQFGRSGDEGMTVTYHPLPRDGEES